MELVSKDIQARAISLAKAAVTVATESGDFKLRKYEVDDGKYNATEFASWTNAKGDLISVHFIRGTESTGGVPL